MIKILLLKLWGSIYMARRDSKVKILIKRRNLLLIKWLLRHWRKGLKESGRLPGRNSEWKLIGSKVLILGWKISLRTWTPEEEKQEQATNSSVMIQAKFLQCQISLLSTKTMIFWRKWDSYNSKTRIWSYKWMLSWK